MDVRYPSFERDNDRPSQKRQKLCRNFWKVKSPKARSIRLLKDAAIRIHKVSDQASFELLRGFERPSRDLFHFLEPPSPFLCTVIKDCN